MIGAELFSRKAVRLERRLRFRNWTRKPGSLKGVFRPMWCLCRLNALSGCQMIRSGRPRKELPPHTRSRTSPRPSFERLRCLLLEAAGSALERASSCSCSFAPRSSLSQRSGGGDCRINTTRGTVARGERIRLGRGGRLGVANALQVRSDLRRAERRTEAAQWKRVTAPARPTHTEDH